MLTRVRGCSGILNTIFTVLLLCVFSLMCPSFSFAACTDLDGDGYGSPGDASCPRRQAIDCNDNDPTVYPGAPRICDGKDNNCDGRLDFSTDIDADADGVLWCAGDCDDSNPNRSPNITEGPYGDATCADAVDNDCDGKATAPPPHNAFNCEVCHVAPDTYITNADIPNSACQSCHGAAAPGAGAGVSDLKGGGKVKIHMRHQGLVDHYTRAYPIFIKYGDFIVRHSLIRLWWTGGFRICSIVLGGSAKAR